MLKIKDNVDLKELGKFGFIVNKDCATYQNASDEYIFIYTNKIIEIEFEHYYDELDITGNSSCHSLSDSLINTLYDLITAGLVEKIDN